MGSHLRVLNESFPMHANMTGFRLFSKHCILVLWMKVASALVWSRLTLILKKGCLKDALNTWQAFRIADWSEVSPLIARCLSSLRACPDSRAF